MSEFDLQGLVQVGISTDRPAHKNIIHEAVGEIAILRTQLEQTEARVAEYEAWRAAFKAACNGSPESWLLRKQAEAVEAAQWLAEKQFPVSRNGVLNATWDYAQRLRQQADEAEKEPQPEGAPS